MSSAVTSSGAIDRARRNRDESPGFLTLTWPRPSRMPSIARMRLASTRSATTTGHGSDRDCASEAAARPRTAAPPISTARRPVRIARFYGISSLLILRWFLDALDDEHVDLLSRQFDLQANLLEHGEQRPRGKWR